MNRPILAQIVTEIVQLFDSLPKGAAWDQRRWEVERNAIVRRHGYRTRPLLRALRAQQYEQWIEQNCPLADVLSVDT